MNLSRLWTIARLELLQRVRTVSWYVLLGVFGLVLLGVTALAFFAYGGWGPGGPGVYSVVVLVTLLLTIWGPLVRSTTPAGRFAAAVFLMFVCHNATEVLMFQNGLMAGLPAWSVIGLGIAVSRVPSQEMIEASALTGVKSRGFVRV